MDSRNEIKKIKEKKGISLICKYKKSIKTDYLKKIKCRRVEGVYIYTYILFEFSMIRKKMTSNTM